MTLVSETSESGVETEAFPTSVLTASVDESEAAEISFELKEEAAEPASEDAAEPEAAELAAVDELMPEAASEDTCEDALWADECFCAYSSRVS